MAHPTFDHRHRSHTHAHARTLSLFLRKPKKNIEILSEAKKSLFATSPPKQEARAGTSRPMERFMAQFAPREGDQSGYRPPVSADDLAIPPLMEGMGEVDTGAF